MSSDGTMAYYDLTGVMKRLGLISHGLMSRADEAVYSEAISRVNK